MAQNIFTKDKINLSIVGPFKEKDKEEYNSLLQKLGQSIIYSRQ